MKETTFVLNHLFKETFDNLAKQCGCQVIYININKSPKVKCKCKFSHISDIEQLRQMFEHHTGSSLCEEY